MYMLTETTDFLQDSIDEKSSLEVVLEPGRRTRQYWRDLWRYRELLYFLAWRDLLVRYKQTVAGVAWALIRPLFTIAVLTIIFAGFAGMKSGSVPYPVLIFCGMLPWQLFASILTDSGNSLVHNSAMISKVYFPRLIVPATSVVTATVDFLISAALLACIMACYRFTPSIRILALPLFLILGLAASFGAGVWISALTVRFRDFRIIVPFIVQIGAYLSPVGFSSSVVPAKWRLLYSVNPIAAVIDGFRWALLGGEHHIYWPGLAMSAATVACLLTSGIIYFRRTERTFADII